MALDRPVHAAEAREGERSYFTGGNAIRGHGDRIAVSSVDPRTDSRAGHPAGVLTLGRQTARPNGFT